MCTGSHQELTRALCMFSRLLSNFHWNKLDTIFEQMNKTGLWKHTHSHVSDLTKIQYKRAHHRDQRLLYSHPVNFSPYQEKQRKSVLPKRCTRDPRSGQGSWRCQGLSILTVTELLLKCFQRGPWLARPPHLCPPR